MKRISELLLAGPVMVGEVRGAKSEILKRFDKSDKNAPPIQFGVFKVNLEMLADGTQVMLTVFLDPSTSPEDFAQRANLKRGDVVAVSVGKTEMKNGVRRAVSAPGGIVSLAPEEVDALRKAGGN